MQTNLKRGKAAPRVRSAGLSVAIVAAASIVATFSFFAPSPALAACGARSAGVHTASASTGVHTGIAASSGASSGGGSGSLGCANGSSASGLRGLPTAASGRVVEPSAHAGRSTNPAKNGAAKTNNATAHLHTVKPAHHA
jgi:hypothetical protein